MSKDKPSLDQLMRDAYAGARQQVIATQAMYTKYLSAVKLLEEPDNDLLVDDPNEHCVRVMTEDEFFWRIDKDEQFKQRWTV
jgi:hypothetical protein